MLSSAAGRAGNDANYVTVFSFFWLKRKKFLPRKQSEDGQSADSEDLRCQLAMHGLFNLKPFFPPPPPLPPPPPTTRSGATEADAPDGSGYVQISLKTINSLFGLDRIRDERPTAWPLSADDAAHRRPSRRKLSR
jgi:hypothetical protein